ncbi:MAG: hypothetical protein KJP16_12110 [Gammaproteobacteria bacterium]|nr:hypothetical protein [Gammaproteobacteria bacterium]NNL51550.1 hypothetical protein [Woeseiaceae bacterium]
MTNLNQQKAQPALFRGIAILLVSLAAIMTAGCAEERDQTDGQLANEIMLPTDLLLNLACEFVGINGETCVLDDPENPYASISIGNSNKFTLFDSIPGGPTGAKARFYLWATALARAPSGENQWYTARALHEVYTYNGDELIRLQALLAYRSNLEFFFGSVSYFDVFGFGIPGTLNEQVACDIYRPPAGYAEICLNEAGAVCNDLGKLELIGSWGFAFKPGPNANDPCANSVVEVINFP